ncbi:restriction endonuclease [Streptomyces sp. B21-083]|uniref:restriction endonuclease n=1 Tax=Streptomyces sp. B21-083 TaxID=3039410 RepID=UPI003FA7C88B
MAEVDALSWQECETYVAELCRRDGCTKVVVSGKSGDLGADVVGYRATAANWSSIVCAAATGVAA